MRPLPDAVADTVVAGPGAVVRTLGGLVTQAGFRIRRASEAEGYLETDWFDTARRASGGAYTRHPDRVIRLRFFADSVGEGLTHLVAEAVYRRRMDPSLPSREQEAMVPPGHPGDSILQGLFAALRERFPRPRS